MRLEWNEQRGKREKVTAVMGQGRDGRALWAMVSWASLNEVAAMGLLGRGGTSRLRFLKMPLAAVGGTDSVG